MSFPTLLAQLCHYCSHKLWKNDVFLIHGHGETIKNHINAEDAHKLKLGDNFFQITCKELNHFEFKFAVGYNVPLPL